VSNGSIHFKFISLASCAFCGADCGIVVLTVPVTVTAQDGGVADSERFSPGVSSCVSWI